MTTVRVNDPDLVDDLMRLLRDSGCVVARIGPHSLSIRSGWPVLDEAGSELDAYLRMFEAMHPEARATRAG